jgi:hypothetical protein
MVYFTELVFENILSFCGGSVRKELLPTIQEGFYLSISKGRMFPRKVKIVKIDTHYWISSDWGRQSWVTNPTTIKKFKKTSDTFVKSKSPVLDISIYTRMECLYHELEWKDLRWETIRLRMFNLEKGFPVNSDPRPFKEIVRSGCAQEAKGYLEWKTHQYFCWQKEQDDAARRLLNSVAFTKDLYNLEMRRVDYSWNKFGQTIDDCWCDLKVERVVLEGLIKKGVL